jgi:hypothetical protein
MDIVERLREFVGQYLGNANLDDELNEAADEIMQLREDLRLAVMSDTEYCKVIEDDNKRLREALQDVIPYIDTCNSEHRDAQERAKNALKEKE